MHEFGHALSAWLRPYHNYARPPASVVLADAAKQAALRGGQPLKGVEIPTNGSTPEHVKKDDEPPAVKEPPEIIIKFFDSESPSNAVPTSPLIRHFILDMIARFTPLLESRLRNEALHVATLTQEVIDPVFCINPSNGKIAFARPYSLSS